MSRHKQSFLLPVGLLSIGLWAGAVFAYSQAQLLLFDTPHLHNITMPTTLHYRVRQEGSLDEPFADRVKLAVERIHPDGTKDASSDFLSGDRYLRFSPVKRFRGNPLLMYFFQWDTRQMQKYLRGHPNYFRNRIRQAFLSRATVEETVVHLNGQAFSAKKIQFQPYTNDPRRAQFRQFEYKRYEIIVADDVPGGLVQLRTEIPGPDGQAPLLVTAFTFVKAEPLTP